MCPFILFFTTTFAVDPQLSLCSKTAWPRPSQGSPSKTALAADSSGRMTARVIYMRHFEVKKMARHVLLPLLRLSSGHFVCFSISRIVLPPCFIANPHSDWSLETGSICVNHEIMWLSAGFDDHLYFCTFFFHQAIRDHACKGFLSTESHSRPYA